MEVVINISEDTYNRIKSGNYTTNPELGFAIQDGIVLPKGHGDLIDRDILLQNWKVIPSRDRLIFDRYIQTLNAVILADK